MPSRQNQRDGEGSLVLNSAFQSSQPRATSRPEEEKPANRTLLVNQGLVSSGFTARPKRAEVKPYLRVFAVDDEDFIRDLYRDVFESKGMTVFSAQSGEEAVKIFSTMKYKPDVVIMDHRMPGKDGIETTKEILKMGNEQGFSRSMIFRARREMARHIINTRGRQAPDNAWQWSTSPVECDEEDDQ